MSIAPDCELGYIVSANLYSFAKSLTEFPHFKECSLHIDDAGKLIQGLMETLGYRTLYGTYNYMYTTTVKAHAKRAKFILSESCYLADLINSLMLDPIIPAIDSHHQWIYFPDNTPVLCIVCFSDYINRYCYDEIYASFDATYTIEIEYKGK